MYKHIFLVLLFFQVIVLNAQQPVAATRWTEKQANDWYAKQGWIVGCNYIPAYAINQLEMWQAATFNPAQIDKELQWAENLGMNSIRVFLHDLLYQQDAAGFFKRMDTFLDIAKKHKIKVLFVIFDSCWDPFPKLGMQRDPKPSVHNSGWVQSPGAEALKDANQYPRLEKYVKAVISGFAKDPRILGWDLWNEPDNMGNDFYKKQDLPDKQDLVYALLPQVFAWARSANPSQPLTAAPWLGDWSTDEKLNRFNKLMFGQSDVISFHNYDKPEELEKRINFLKRFNRPLLCTEYMARGNASTFKDCLPVLKKYKAGAYNWGFVSGKSQTIYAWDSWEKQYDTEPPLWFHDIFRQDGTPYKQEEVDLIRQLTGKK